MQILIAQLSDEAKEGLLNNVEKAREIQDNFSSFNPAFAITIGTGVLIILTLGWLTAGAISRTLKKEKKNIKKTDESEVKEAKPMPKIELESTPVGAKEQNLKIEHHPQKSFDSIHRKK